MWVKLTQHTCCDLIFINYDCFFSSNGRTSLSVCPHLTCYHLINLYFADVPLRKIMVVDRDRQWVAPILRSENHYGTAEEEDVIKRLPPEPQMVKKM